MRPWWARRKLIVALVVAAALMAIGAAASAPSSAESLLPEQPGDISSGEFATCATTAVGKVECDNRRSWSPVKGLDDVIAVSVSTEWWHQFDPINTTACGLHADGTVSCWFPLQSTRFTGNTESQASPEKISGLTDAVAIALGTERACALSSSGTVSCWRKNYQEPDLKTTTADFATPVQISGILTATAISSKCAVVAAGNVKCWDSLYTGSEASAVQLPGIDDARSLSHGAGTMCVVHKNGRVSCGLTSEGSPIYVDGISDVIEASTYYWSSGVDYGNGAAQDSGACGLLNDGTVSCWDNLDAQSPPCSASALKSTSGDGYWVFTDRGTVYAFGDAQHYGDLPAQGISPVGGIVSSSATPSGNGYYMLGSDGGVFAFGDADFAGSVPQVLPGVVLNCPIVGLVPIPAGNGYWLVACDGGVFAFGDAEFYGSVPQFLPVGATLVRPVNGMVAYANSYLMVGSDGGVFNFSHAQFLGSLALRSLASPVVAIAAFAG